MNGARVGTLQIVRARAAVSLPPLRTPATIVRPDLIASDMATYLIPCCPLQTLLLSSASAKASRILPAVSYAAAQSNSATNSRGAVLYPLSLLIFPSHVIARVPNAVHTEPENSTQKRPKPCNMCISGPETCMSVRPPTRPAPRVWYLCPAIDQQSPLLCLSVSAMAS